MGRISHFHFHYVLGEAYDRDSHWVLDERYRVPHNDTPRGILVLLGFWFCKAFASRQAKAMGLWLGRRARLCLEFGVRPKAAMACVCSEKFVFT